MVGETTVQPQQDAGMGMGGGMISQVPSMPQPDYQLHKWLIDITILTSNIEDKLRGKYWVIDHKTGEYKEKKTKALMNDDGIHAIMSKIETYCGPNFQFSYFSQDQVNRIMESLVYEINTELAISYSKYGIPREDVEGISSLILNSIFASLSKAVDGKLMDHIQKIATLTQYQSLDGNRGGNVPGGMSSGGTRKKWMGFF